MDTETFYLDILNSTKNTNEILVIGFGIIIGLLLVKILFDEMGRRH